MVRRNLKRVALAIGILIAIPFLIVAFFAGDHEPQGRRGR